MQTILIIGGSKGIGNAILKSSLEKYKVINFSRTKPEIIHDNLIHHKIDVLVDNLPELENIDKLVYCPGSINLKPITHLSIDEFKDDFNINVICAIKAIKKYLNLLKKSDHASVLLFSTVASKIGMAFHSSVAVSKSAIEGLTKSLAAEYATSIRFNAIAPTLTDTDLASKLLRNDKLKESMKQRHPLKKYLDPKEVANLANYLLSNDSKSISGQIFNIDCGITSIKV